MPKKTPSKKVAEVINEKIKNPDLSIRDLEKKTGVNYRTAARILNRDMAHLVTSSDVIANLVEENSELLVITSGLLKKNIEDETKEGKKIRYDDLCRIQDLALKQNALVGALSNPEANKQINVTFNL